MGCTGSGRPWPAPTRGCRAGHDGELPRGAAADADRFARLNGAPRSSGSTESAASWPGMKSRSPALMPTVTTMSAAAESSVDRMKDCVRIIGQMSMAHACASHSRDQSLVALVHCRCGSDAGRRGVDRHHFIAGGQHRDQGRLRTRRLVHPVVAASPEMVGMESRARCHEHIALRHRLPGMDRVADLDVDRIESHRLTPAVAAITSFMGDHQIKGIGDRSTGGDGDARAFRHIDVGGAACGQMPVAVQRRLPARSVCRIA